MAAIFRGLHQPDQGVGEATQSIAGLDLLEQQEKTPGQRNDDRVRPRAEVTRLAGSRPRARGESDRRAAKHPRRTPGGARDHRGETENRGRRQGDGRLSRGQLLAVEIKTDGTTYTLEQGDGLTIYHRDERLDLRPGLPVRRP